MTPDEFRKEGYRLIDWIADYRAGIAARPLMAAVTPGSLKAALPKAPPEQPESFDAIFADIDRLIAPGISHFQHPRFFGYFPANSDLGSVLGDYLSTGLGVIGLSWQSSPALTELEEVMTDWVRQSDRPRHRWHGVIQDTASTSTLVALISAREKVSNYGLAKGGVAGRGRAAHRLCLRPRAQFGSTKAATLAGFGAGNIRHVPVDADLCDEAGCLACRDRTGSRGGGSSLAPSSPVSGRPRRRRSIRCCRSAPLLKSSALAACRCGHGGIGDDPAGMPLDVRRHRGCGIR